MIAGKRDRRIKVQRATSYTRNALGEQIPTWSTIATVWASWRRASARETLAAAEVSAIVTDVFEILWQPALADLGPQDQLLFGGRAYDIADAVEIGRRNGIMITGSARREGSPA